MNNSIMDKDNLSITSDNRMTKIGKVSTDRTKYRVKNLDYSSRNHQGLTGISKADKEKGVNLAYSMVKVYGLNNLSLLTLTYDHGDKAVIETISKNMNYLIKSIVRKIKTKYDDFILSIGIQEKVTRKYKFPVYDLNLIVSTSEGNLPQLYRDIIRLINNSKPLLSVGTIRPLNDPYLIPLKSESDKYPTWVDYYTWQQVSIQMIKFCKKQGKEDYLLHKWLYCGLSEITKKYAKKIQVFIDCPKDWKKDVTKLCEKKIDTLEVLPEKHRQGLVIGHKNPLSDNPDEINNLFIEALTS